MVAIHTFEQALVSWAPAGMGLISAFRHSVLLNTLVAKFDFTNHDIIITLSYLYTEGVRRRVSWDKIAETDGRERYQREID